MDIWIICNTYILLWQIRVNNLNGHTRLESFKLQKGKQRRENEMCRVDQQQNKRRDVKAIDSATMEGFGCALFTPGRKQAGSHKCRLCVMASQLYFFISTFQFCKSNNDECSSEHPVIRGLSGCSDWVIRVCLKKDRGLWWSSQACQHSSSCAVYFWLL